MLVIALGTGAEFLRCMPLLKILQKRKIEHRLLFSGQNKIAHLLEYFEIYDDNIIELKSFEGVSINPAKGFIKTPPLILEMRKTLHSLDPDCVVCHGDTLTAAATAMASSGVFKIAHIEAGFRSRSILEPLPEELFRIIVDRKSNYLYTPSLMCSENLRREKVKGEIITTGSTVPDVVKIALNMTGQSLSKEKFVVVTTHRYENIFVKSRLKKILEIISLPTMPVIWPIHKITEEQLKKYNFIELLKRNNIQTCPSLPYLEFIKMLSRCSYVITDGGSIEEESLVLNKHCLLLRKRTERVEGLKTGLTHLTKVNIRYSRKLINEVEADVINDHNVRNPYQVNESASDAIADHLESLIKA